MSKPDTANLEDGFYWVRECSLWQVALIHGDQVYFAGRDVFSLTSNMREIDPRPIKREE